MRLTNDYYRRQAYEAEFRMIHAIQGSRLDQVYQELADTPGIRKACIIAHIAMEAYVMDVVELVMTAVIEEIATDPNDE